MLTRARKILAILALAVTSGPAFAYTLFLRPVAQTISVGQTASFDFGISEIDPNFGLGGYQFDLSFDPAIVSFVGAEAAGAMAGSPFFNVDDAVGGVVGIVDVVMDQVLADTVTLATISFRGLSAGTSPLTFSNVFLSDLLGAEVTATDAEGGEVTVNQAVPEPTTPLLLGLALLLMAAWPRPRRAGGLRW